MESQQLITYEFEQGQEIRPEDAPNFGKVEMKEDKVGPVSNEDSLEQIFAKIGGFGKF